MTEPGKPLRSVWHKGIQVTEWSDSYSICKRWKDKNTGEWKSGKNSVSFFKNEMDNLVEVINLTMHGLETGSPQQKLIDLPPNAIPKTSVEDDDIPF